MAETGNEEFQKLKDEEKALEEKLAELSLYDKKSGKDFQIIKEKLYNLMKVLEQYRNKKLENCNSSVKK